MKKYLPIFLLAAAFVMGGCGGGFSPQENASGTVLSFRSFDGGGPEFSIAIADPEIVTYTCDHRYDDPAHEQMNGSGYDVVFSFTGLKPGETTFTISARSPIADEFDAVYAAAVGEDLQVTLTELSFEPLGAAEMITPVPTLVIEANGRVFYASPEDNPSAEAFIENLSHGEIELELHDYGNFEKVGDLPWELPRNDETITTGPGDVILYQGDQITIYYDENTWDFTRLARIEDVSREELLEAFGAGDVTVRCWVEWSE